MICTCCQRFTQTDRIGPSVMFNIFTAIEERVQPELVEHWSYRQLCQSQHDCTLCARIWAVLNVSGPDLKSMLAWYSKVQGTVDDIREIPLSYHVYWVQDRENLEDKKVLEILVGTNRIRAIQFEKVPQGADSPFDESSADVEAMYPYKEPYQPTGLEAFRKRLPQVKQWLELCDTGHENCKTGQRAGAWLPSRLVQVTCGPEGTLKAKLCCSASLEEPVRYMTLSYSSGSTPYTTLTSSVYDKFQENIPIDDLRSIFVDAFRVCSELGVDFIWIRSLCIVKDSEEDRSSEADAVHKIYSNSYLNLAASGARDGHDGLFRSWSDRLVEPSFFTDSTGQQYHNPDHFEAPMFKVDFINSPLHRQAWVVQELFLSPRTLHFTKLQLYWQCKQRVDCSVTIAGRPGMFEGRNLPNVYSFVADHLFDQGGLEYHKRPWRKAWEQVVQDYAGSYPYSSEDKLVAFQGIAQHFQQLPALQKDEEEYMVGLWKSCLPLDLLWYPTHGHHTEGMKVGYNRKWHNRSGQSQLGRPETTVAPSWSWLSINGPITWGPPGIMSLFSMLFPEKFEDTCIENLEFASVKSGNYVHGILSFQAPAFHVNITNKVIFISAFGGGGRTFADVKPSIHFDTNKESEFDGDYIFATVTVYQSSSYRIRGLLLQEASSTEKLRTQQVIDLPDGPIYVRRGIWSIDPAIPQSDTDKPVQTKSTRHWTENGKRYRQEMIWDGKEYHDVGPVTEEPPLDSLWDDDSEEGEGAYDSDFDFEDLNDPRVDEERKAKVEALAEAYHKSLPKWTIHII